MTPSSISPPSANGNIDGSLIASTDLPEEEEYDSDGEWHVQPRPLDVVDHDQASVEVVLSDCGFSPHTASNLKRRGSASLPRRMRLRSRIGSVIRAQNELHRDNFVLPPHTLASELVDLFFTHAFPLFPFVHEPTFRRRFAATYRKSNSEPLDIPWQSTLNLVFAFGCDYLCLPLQQIYELSQTFHRRGTELILSVCFDTSTLDVIQALLLVSAHLQSNMQFNRFWSSMACILRSAQGLGFHIDPRDWDIGFVEKEMRRRLWWGMYSLDRFVSLKHGRPPATTLETLPVGPPATVHDEYITDAGISGIQSSDTPSSMHFFNAIVQLAHIAETMLAYMLRDAPWCLPGRGPRSTRDPDPIRLNIQIGLVVEQEGKLAKWLSGLPDHLQFSAETADEKIKRQQKMLRVRYLHIRLMSHRPNLLSVIQVGRDDKATVLGDKFLESVVMASVRQCVECACDIIAVLQNTTGPEDMGAWWYHLPCTHSFTRQSTRTAARAPKMNGAYNHCSSVHCARNALCRAEARPHIAVY
ncbi:hypothetical protein CONLIGDRAFT_627257 [Coniochaeta ligniaria NRRL 30616]|uniref:Xylanolytic transcriptional activator regulatory domain-containing protein n=1 Tax=Coniochaeta ligniaria NRRL 30616 TaxID=1408157 RepID=A0A1J7JYI0_9PEZI|nr:hypothetical protein CONLIGDRAFT_627257 [Coniochaeta ligniaria NRRL 30616]